MVLLSIGDSDVLFGSVDKFLAELLLELRVLAVDLHIFQIFVQFQFIEFSFLELLEGLLDGALGSQVLIGAGILSYLKLSKIVGLLNYNYN